MRIPMMTQHDSIKHIPCCTYFTYFISILSLVSACYPYTISVHYTCYIYCRTDNKATLNLEPWKFNVVGRAGSRFVLVHKTQCDSPRQCRDITARMERYHLRWLSALFVASRKYHQPSAPPTHRLVVKYLRLSNLFSEMKKPFGLEAKCLQGHKNKSSCPNFTLLLQDDPDDWEPLQAIGFLRELLSTACKPYKSV